MSFLTSTVNGKVFSYYFPLWMYMLTDLNFKYLKQNTGMRFYVFVSIVTIFIATLYIFLYQGEPIVLPVIDRHVRSTDRLSEGIGDHLFTNSINKPRNGTTPCKPFTDEDLTKKKNCTAFNNYYQRRKPKSMVKYVCDGRYLLSLITKNLDDKSRNAYLNRIECIMDYVQAHHEMYDQEKYFSICKNNLKGEVNSFTEMYCHRELCIVEKVENMNCLRKKCGQYSVDLSDSYEALTSFKFLNVEYDFKGVCKDRRKKIISAETNLANQTDDDGIERLNSSTYDDSYEKYDDSEDEVYTNNANLIHKNTLYGEYVLFLTLLCIFTVRLWDLI